MINLLIRNSIGRYELLKRCLKSVSVQTYKPINLFISTDSPEAKEDTIRAIDFVKNHRTTIIDVTPDPEKKFYWNLYCNTLKAQIVEGWFMYLDSDDFLNNPNVLMNLSHHLKNEKYAVMCRFLRHGRPKPSGRYMGKIIRGAIGGSCIVLHHTHKDLANWQSCKGADYLFMKDIASKLPIRWTDVVVVEAGNGGLKGGVPK